jgi:hypothetical protein
MTLQSLRTFLTSGGLLAQLAPARGQWRDVAYLVAGNVLKFALGLAPSMLIFRALGPTDVGRLTLALNIISLF